MRNPFKRKPKPYESERGRLLGVLEMHDPETDEYKAIMARLNELDRLINRTSEFKKVVIPAIGTIGAVTGIYALQQFAGVIVPKALDSLAARQEQKKQNQEQD